VTELLVLSAPRLVLLLDPDEVRPLPTRFKPCLPSGGPGGGMDETGLVDAPSAPPATAPDKKSPKGGK
jgi:hypothetical protein